MSGHLLEKWPHKGMRVKLRCRDLDDLLCYCLHPGFQHLVLIRSRFEDLSSAVPSLPLDFLEVFCSVSGVICEISENRLAVQLGMIEHTVSNIVKRGVLGYTTADVASDAGHLNNFWRDVLCKVLLLVGS